MILLTARIEIQKWDSTSVQYCLYSVQMWLISVEAACIKRTGGVAGCVVDPACPGPPPDLITRANSHSRNWYLQNKEINRILLLTCPFSSSFTHNKREKLSIYGVFVSAIYSTSSHNPSFLPFSATLHAWLLYTASLERTHGKSYQASNILGTTPAKWWRWTSCTSCLQ